MRIIWGPYKAAERALKWTTRVYSVNLFAARIIVDRPLLIHLLIYEQRKLRWVGSVCRTTVVKKEPSLSGGEHESQSYCIAAVPDIQLRMWVHHPCHMSISHVTYKLYDI